MNPYRPSTSPSQVGEVLVALSVIIDKKCKFNVLIHILRILFDQSCSGTNDERHQFREIVKFFVFSNNHSNSVLDIRIFLCFNQKTQSTSRSDLFILIEMESGNQSMNSSQDDCIVLALSPLRSTPSTGADTPQQSISKPRLSKAEIVSKNKDDNTSNDSLLSDTTKIGTGGQES